MAADNGLDLMHLTGIDPLDKVLGTAAGLYGIREQRKMEQAKAQQQTAPTKTVNVDPLTAENAKQGGAVQLAGLSVTPVQIGVALVAVVVLVKVLK